MMLTTLCGLLEQNGLSVCLEGRDRLVRAVNTLEDAVDGELSFLSNPKYLRSVSTTNASAVILPDGIELPNGLAALRSRDPYAAVTAAIVHLHGHRKHPQWGVHSGAIIHPSAKVGRGANIAAGVTIAADAVVGDDCTIYPGCFIGDRASLGDQCVLYPNVVIYDGCNLGRRVTIHAGSVIGEDGLGYAPLNGQWIKIPQVGRAVIGDDVEIGANCTIDRATLGQTEIGPGTKFGNVVVIGHGTKVGPDCLFVGLVGIAGSVKVGRHVTLAGQVGVGGHITIGDDAKIAAQSGILADVEPKANLLGAPGMPLEDAKRCILWYQRLPELARRVKELEREVARLASPVKSSD